MADIAFEGRGTGGVPLILVHGFPLDHSMWRGQLAGLGSMARVVSIDMPGFGASPPPPSPDALTMDDMSDLVIEVADGLGFARFVLAGLSMGGYVAMALARRHPERLAGLALINTRAEPDAPEVRRQRAQDASAVVQQGVGFLVERLLRRLLSAGTQAKRPELVMGVETMMRRCHPVGLAAALRGMAQRPDSRNSLGDVVVPTLVIAGADDIITPPAMVQPMAARIRGAEMAVIPGAGHMSPYEAPDAVNAALRKLLRRAAPHMGRAIHGELGGSAVPAQQGGPPPPAPRRKEPRGSSTKDSRRDAADYDGDDPTFAMPPRRRGPGIAR